MSVIMNTYMHIKRKVSMNINNENIIQLIKKKIIVTSSEVAEDFGVSWNTAEKYLMELLIDGKINRMKKTGVTLWMMK